VAEGAGGAEAQAVKSMTAVNKTQGNVQCFIADPKSGVGK
jgi:hypothetical protein